MFVTLQFSVEWHKFNIRPYLPFLLHLPAQIGFFLLKQYKIYSLIEL